LHFSPNWIFNFFGDLDLRPGCFGDIWAAVLVMPEADFNADKFGTLERSSAALVSSQNRLEVAGE